MILESTRQTVPLRESSSMRSTVLTRILLALLMLCGASTVASASVAVRIDVSRQTMSVMVEGDHFATWKVSTARPGYHTPRGRFRPYLLKRMHYSSKYENSPMPHSIFFLGGYAIHGTGYVRSLGRPASHGCIRLAPRNAALLYALVKQYGKRNTRIVITN
jgi:lipoprotein-anchoring transpeptidase ErfK/SrfK